MRRRALPARRPSRRFRRLRKTPLFLSFPYVCPKPVLVKKIVFIYKCLKKRGVFRTGVGGCQEALRTKRLSVSTVSYMCLSRACLGKLSMCLKCIHEWLQKGVFIALTSSIPSYLYAKYLRSHRRREYIYVSVQGGFKCRLWSPLFLYAAGFSKRLDLGRDGAVRMLMLAGAVT